VTFYLSAELGSDYVLRSRHKKEQSRCAGYDSVALPRYVGFAAMALYQLLRKEIDTPEGGSFTPEEVVVLGTAYEAILVVLRLNDRLDPITEIIATKVIQLFQSGERDPTQICNRAIKELGIPILDGGDS
jgi:hypothetical protein